MSKKKIMLENILNHFKDIGNGTLEGYRTAKKLRDFPNSTNYPSEPISFFRIISRDLGEACYMYFDPLYRAVDFVKSHIKNNSISLKTEP